MTQTHNLHISYLLWHKHTVCTFPIYCDTNTQCVYFLFIVTQTHSVHISYLLWHRHTMCTFLIYCDTNTVCTFLLYCDTDTQCAHFLFIVTQTHNVHISYLLWHKHTICTFPCNPVCQATKIHPTVKRLKTMKNEMRSELTYLFSIAKFFQALDRKTTAQSKKNKKMLFRVSSPFHGF